MEEKDRISFSEPITIQVGPILQTMPAVMVYELGMSIKVSLLDRYELVEGIPTANNPNPEPYLVRKTNEFSE